MKKRILSLALCIFMAVTPGVPCYAQGDTYNPISSSFNKEKVKEISSGSDDIMGGGKGFDGPFIKSYEDERWASGGVDHTHQYLAARGIEIFIKDKGNDFEEVIYPYAHVLLYATDLPDIDENERLYAAHFYHYVFKKNFLLFGDTAKDRFIEHSQLALDLFNYDRHLAFIELGRAIHYLEDMNEPHHASNLTALNSNHIRYEIWADRNRSRFKIYAGSLYDSYSQMDFLTALDTLADRCACNAYNMKDYATAKKIEPMGAYPVILMDYDKWAISADSTMSYAQDAISTYLYIFFKEAKVNSFIKLASLPY